MSVYVDAAMIPYGRMKMSHMLADTQEELLAMADAIGLGRHWIQHPGKPMEHFDVSMVKRDMALQEGAIAMTSRQLVGIVRKKRAALTAEEASKNVLAR